MGEADVQKALERLARVLEAEGIPYAIVGALALNEWGYRRVTVDVDVLLSAEGLRRLKAEVLGRGYVERFPGSRGLRDTEANVDIDFLIAGEYPGDGKPKPVAFPDPAQAGPSSSSAQSPGSGGAFPRRRWARLRASARKPRASRSRSSRSSPAVRTSWPDSTGLERSGRS